jgi:hypothetical protein
MTSQPPDEHGELPAVLIDVLATNDLKDLIAEVADVGLESLMNSDLLGDVPVVGTLFKLIGVAGGVRDALFARKLIRFIETVASGGYADRQRILEELDSDENKKRKAGEALLLYLDRMDDVDKATLLANAYMARLRRDISLTQFHALAAVINRIMLTFSREYCQLFWLNNSLLDDHFERASELSNCDLAQRPSAARATPLVFTSLGRDFFQHVLGFDEQELRTNFEKSVRNMAFMERVTDDKYEFEVIDQDAAVARLSHLSRKQLLELKIQVAQVNLEGNAWMIRRVGTDEYQRFWEK